MPPDPEPLTPLQRAWRTVVLFILLAAVLWATWDRFTGRRVKASPASIYPEVKRGVVQPVPDMELPDTCGIVWDGTHDEGVYCWSKLRDSMEVEE